MRVAKLIQLLAESESRHIPQSLFPDGRVVLQLVLPRIQPHGQDGHDDGDGTQGQHGPRRGEIVRRVLGRVDPGGDDAADVVDDARHGDGGRAA